MRLFEIDYLVVMERLLVGLSCKPVMFRTILVCTFVVVSGCWSKVSTQEYNDSCETSLDCAAVYEGNICDQCKNPTAAISESAKSEYNAYLRSLESVAGCVNLNPSTCTLYEPELECRSGTCIIAGQAR